MVKPWGYLEPVQASAIMLLLLRQKPLKGMELPKLPLSIFGLLNAEAPLEFEWYRAAQIRPEKQVRVHSWQPCPRHQGGNCLSKGCTQGQL